MRLGLPPERIRTGAAYDLARGKAQAEAVALRRRRRVDLGDLASLVFENRETLQAVVEEMLRAERLEDPERIAAEIAAFDSLVPGEGELSASLYLEVGDAAELSALLADLDGLGESVYLEIAEERVGARVERLESGPGGQPALYLGFALDLAQRRAWREGARVLVGVGHLAYTARSELSETQRAAIAADL